MAPIGGDGTSIPPGHRRRYALVLAASLVGLVFVVPVPAAPVTLTAPYVPTPVADADLDGDPATGAWADASAIVVPLENGRTDAYGSARLYAKHDGTFLYFRIDGKVDVPWASATGSHFWFGMLFSPIRNGHHQSGQDSVFFGETALRSATPILPVDCNGGGKPPAKDAQQDAVGEMRASGTAKPYDFTAEWKRKLNTNDARDLAFIADGTTPYYFYATTDSDGSGSGGGAISHKQTTNDNILRFAPPPGADVAPPSVSIVSPTDGATVSQSVLLAATASDDVGVTSVTFLLDGRTLSVDAAAPFEYAWSTVGVANGTHTIRAEARDAVGHVASTEITVTVVAAPPDTTAPAAPRDLSANPAGLGAVVVSWSPGAEADILGYFVFRLNGEGDAVQLNGEPVRNATYLDAGLEPGRAYVYGVKAADLSGNLSPASSLASGTAGTAGIDLSAIGWAAGPGVAALLFLVLAKLVGREERRGRTPPTPPEEEAE